MDSHDLTWDGGQVSVEMSYNFFHQFTIYNLTIETTESKDGQVRHLDKIYFMIKLINSYILVKLKFIFHIALHETGFGFRVYVCLNPYDNQDPDLECRSVSGLTK